MQKWLAKWWKNYKFRFIPWIAMNVKHYEEKTLPLKNDVTINEKPSFVPVHHMQKSEEIRITDDDLCKLLTNYFTKCHYPLKNSWKSSMQDLEQITFHNKRVMKDHFGFVVERRKSKVSAEAGTGVFITEGVARTGSVVALYCGTLYMPSEPLFFPSLGNKYIFRCSDGIHIDGNDKWISKSIYKSCAARDQFDFDTPSCDTSWLTPYPINPLNVGQYVNNRSHSHDNNVMYQECSVRWDSIFQQASKTSKDLHSFSLEGEDSGAALIQPIGHSHIKCGGGDDDEAREQALCSPPQQPSFCQFPIRHARFLPNAWSDPYHIRSWRGLRLVPLLALRDIGEGEELLSSYFTVVHDDDIKKEQRT